MKITLKNMMFYGYHGLHKVERTLGQRFSVDITAITNPELDTKIKKLSDTIDYTAIYDVVKNEVENYKYHLLEKLADKVLVHILREFSLVKKCRIKIRKIAVPISGTLDYVELEMERES